MDLTEILDLFPDEIKDSLRWYTGNEYQDFNFHLRTRNTEKYRTTLFNIDWAFDQIPPLTEPLVVYKGIRDNIIFDDAAFISTSSSPETARKFTRTDGCCLLEITVVPGSKVLPLHQLSQYPCECEILLDRDGILMLTHRDENTFYVTYLPGKSRYL